MKCMDFSDAEYAGKHMQAAARYSLLRLVSCAVAKFDSACRTALSIGLKCPSALSLMAMLRMRLIINWFGYRDPVAEEDLYITSVLDFLYRWRGVAVFSRRLEFILSDVSAC